MKITVKARTQARTEKVEQLDSKSFKVSVKASPIEGKANEAIIRALAEHFDVARSRIILISGQTSKQKVFEIE